MKFPICGEVVFKGVSAIVPKKLFLLNYKITMTKLSGHEGWVECICVVEFQLSSRYLIFCVTKNVTYSILHYYTFFCGRRDTFFPVKWVNVAFGRNRPWLIPMPSHLFIIAGASFNSYKVRLKSDYQVGWTSDFKVGLKSDYEVGPKSNYVNLNPLYNWTSINFIIGLQSNFITGDWQGEDGQ